MGAQTEVVFQFLRDVGAAHGAITRIVLFGSRARGENGERSDFDVAIDAPAMDDEDWARIALHIRENVPTLCGIDLVRLNADTNQELQQKILTEGKSIYEHK